MTFDTKVIDTRMIRKISRSHATQQRTILLLRKATMSLSKDDPDELLQFDAASVAIRAGSNVETLAKLN